MLCAAASAALGGCGEPQDSPSAGGAGPLPAVRSGDCAPCHPDEHASWGRTYHKTMTQRAARDTVMAPFGGERLEVQGIRAEMSWEGGPVVRFFDGDDVVLTADVRLTVGSHRYQQYVAEIQGTHAPADAGRGSTLGDPGTLWRLPVAWYPEHERWIHMNTAFLEPDEFEADSYFRHLNRWNDNCVFCHNVDPVPGQARVEGPFDTEVAELGIACGSCHGDGRAHVAARREPWRAAFGHPVAAGITHPGRLEGQRATDVCGRCHGQRIAHDLRAVLASGDGFSPGMELSAVSRPIQHDSTINGARVAAFESRFWPDGSPRLSAYEYQALEGSACFADGAGISCGDCHDMHRAGQADSREPMQLLAAVQDDPDTACTSCHPGMRGAPEAGSNAGRESHGGHEPSSAGCVDCHMPPQTYGLLSALISHRIDSPEPGRMASAQPDACTSCHVERSRVWAAAAMADLGFPGAEAAVKQPPDRPWASRVEIDLIGGDPIVRVLAAASLGSPRAVGERSRRASWLAQALEDDYAVVRVVAHRGLKSLAIAGTSEALDAFDPFAAPEHRASSVARVRAAVGPFPGSAEQLAELRDRQSGQRISIGE